ncbi:MAG: hypothetical protein PHN78_08610, partial [Dehalococcoidales bacterium]|nr:hypothetical protein [Dehalococcoidales bacterium]
EFTVTEEVLRIAGEDAEGFYDYRAESPFSEDTEAARYYTDVFKWATGEEKWSESRISLSILYTIRAAIKQAVADEGWENLSSETIYAALNKLTDIDTGDNFGNFGYGPDKRIGVSTIKIKRFTKDGSVAASDWITLPRIFEGIDN